MESVDERMRSLVLKYGWNSTCYQLLNPGFQYWFNSRKDGGTGYVEYARTRVVGGSPICAHEELSRVVDEFEADAGSRGLRVCYFASEARLEACIAKREGYAIVLLGAQPVWHPRVLVENIMGKSSLRTQLYRARNKGVTVEEWNAKQATESPQLRHLLHEWLGTRGLPSLHFLVEPETLSNLDDRRIFVARVGSGDAANHAGKVVGFLNVSPIPERNGWLVEQFVRGNAAPNGTIELLLYHAAETLANEGFHYLTLGLSPLTPYADPQTPHISPFIRFLLRWARAHGKRFYNFEGLEFFKTKFEPESWEPIYAISNEPRFSLRSLYAIACAFTRGHPVWTVLLGIRKAITQEVRWMALLIKN